MLPSCRIFRLLLCINTTCLGCGLKPLPMLPPCHAGVVWGWCVAGFAFLPYALWVLAAAPLMKAVGVLLLCLLGTLVPLALVDRHFYGRWMVSLLLLLLLPQSCCCSLSQSTVPGLLLAWPEHKHAVLCT